MIKCKSGFNKLDLWLLGICSSRVLTYLVFMAYAAALPVLQQEWDMSATAAGAISGGFQFGYAVSLLFFSILADRIGSKRVFLLSSFCTVIASLLFAFLARDFYSGFILFTLVGTSLGGSYTPGLMMIADRYEPSQTGAGRLGFSLPAPRWAMRSPWPFAVRYCPGEAIALHFY